MFIKAFSGALGGAFADQWLDFYTVPDQLPATAAIFPAAKRGQNAGRGSNTKGSENIITDGSKIVVPEGYGLITFQDGAVTGLITDPGGFVFDSSDPNAQSMFSGGGIFETTLKNSFQRFKYGGIPGSQQVALFVTLKELPNNRFGTQSEIYWDDAYLNAQVGAVTRGSYTLKIVDPVLFVKGFVPAAYLSGERVFDFTDFDNPASEQLFTEVVSSLAPAFSRYTNDPNKNHRITALQSDSLGFAQSLSAEVESGYAWLTQRGLQIVSVAIASIEYDEDTRELLSKVKRADAMIGARGNSNLQASIAQGVESAGEHSGAGGLAALGFGAGMMGGLGSLQQPVGQPQAGAGQGAPAAQGTPDAGAPATAPPEDPYEKLAKLKGLLDDGVISQADFDAAKAKVLGI